MDGLVARFAPLLLAWACQTAALCLFKFGGLRPEWRLTGFVLGNVFGVTGTWFMIILYRHMNVNVATGLLLGGGFMVAQVTMALVYHSRINAAQWGGIACIAIGMALVALYATQPDAASSLSQPGTVAAAPVDHE